MTLKLGKKNNKTYKQIAVDLPGRSEEAIKARWCGAGRKHMCQQSHLFKKPPIARPQVCVDHDDIPDWYEIGWVFVGVEEDGRYIFEWPNKREPQYAIKIRKPERKKIFEFA